MLDHGRGQICELSRDFSIEQHRGMNFFPTPLWAEISHMCPRIAVDVCQANLFEVRKLPSIHSTAIKQPTKGSEPDVNGCLDDRMHWNPQKKIAALTIPSAKLSTRNTEYAFQAFTHEDASLHGSQQNLTSRAFVNEDLRGNIQYKNATILTLFDREVETTDISC